MKKKYKNYSLFIAFAVVSFFVLTLASCATEEITEEEVVDDEVVDEEETEIDDKFGGTLEVAFYQNIAHLDPDQTTSPEIGEVAYHIVESLFESTEEYEPIPHLAESYEVSEDGKTYTFQLREGVLFHNGKEMTSEDVKASMERWFAINNGGGVVAPYVDSININDTYEIELNMNEVYAPLLSMMAAFPANQKLNIWPKELVEEYGEDRITNAIGTGPYKLAEFAEDEYVVLERFEDYEPVDKPASAYAGERKAYFDKIVIRYVPEEAVRIAGAQTGEYHVADSISIDQLEMLEQYPEIQPHPSVRRTGQLTVKTQNPPADNVDFRRALNYAINNEELADIVIGEEDLYSLDASQLGPDSIWHVSNVGEGVFGVHDPDKAKELLEEVGYDGEAIVFMGDSGNVFEQRAGVALDQMLTDVGINVELQMMDRATLVERRVAKDQVHIMFDPFQQYYPDPQVFEAWFGTMGYITDWDTEESREMDEIFDRMRVELDFDKRHDIVREWNEKTYENLHYIQLFNYSELATKRNEVQDFITFDNFIFFNVWFE